MAGVKNFYVVIKLIRGLFIGKFPTKIILDKVQKKSYTFYIFLNPSMEIRNEKIVQKKSTDFLHNPLCISKFSARGLPHRPRS